MAHCIKINPSADKHLSSLDASLRRRIMQAIDKLALVPRPPGCKKLKSRDAYRIKVGEYRVIYEIRDDILIVLVVRVAHRRDAYK